MGLILDSSILIAGERGGESVRAILKRVQATQGEAESGLSAVTVVELTHGIYRPKTDTHRERRRAFTEDLCRDLTVHPVTLEIAQLAGKVEGEQAARGISIAFEDLLIGTTALQRATGENYLAWWASIQKSRKISSLTEIGGQRTTFTSISRRPSRAQSTQGYWRGSLPLKNPSGPGCLRDERATTSMNRVRSRIANRGSYRHPRKPDSTATIPWVPVAQ
jgi:predicted nucleic acid-binding protein